MYDLRLCALCFLVSVALRCDYLTLNNIPRVLNYNSPLPLFGSNHDFVDLPRAVKWSDLLPNY